MIAEIGVDCVQQDYVERAIAAIQRLVRKNVWRRLMRRNLHTARLVETEIHHLLRGIVLFYNKIFGCEVLYR